MRPLDTTPEAWAIQQEIFRRMTPEQRLRAVMEMSDSVRALALAGVRSRNPQLSEAEIVREYRRLIDKAERRP